MVRREKRDPGEGPEVDESQLQVAVQAAATGDEDALQLLILHYHGVLHRIVERRLDGALRRQAEADDVLQEAYAMAFGGIRACRFDGPAGFYRWLETITLHRLAEVRRDLHRRKRDIRRERAGSAGGPTTHLEFLQRLADSGSTPSRTLSRVESASVVISSLARLPTDQRLVIRRRFIENHSIAQIAADMEKSHAAVHMLCHRGLTRLRLLLQSATTELAGR